MRAAATLTGLGVTERREPSIASSRSLSIGSGPSFRTVTNTWISPGSVALRSAAMPSMPAFAASARPVT